MCRWRDKPCFKSPLSFAPTHYFPNLNFMRFLETSRGIKIVSVEEHSLLHLGIHGQRIRKDITCAQLQHRAPYEGRNLYTPGGKLDLRGCKCLWYRLKLYMMKSPLPPTLASSSRQFLTKKICLRE